MDLRGEAIMPSLFGAPEITASGDGRLEAFVFDRAGGLQHAWQSQWSNSNSWAGWCDMGQSGGWPATVAASGDGRLELAVAAGDQLVQSASQTAWSNGWSQWALLAPPPSATVVRDVLNEPVSAAEAEIIAAHLTPVITGSGSVVVEQSPLPDATVPEGTTVHLAVAPIITP
jgi:hypothetical protein